MDFSRGYPGLGQFIFAILIAGVVLGASCSPIISCVRAHVQVVLK